MPSDRRVRVALLVGSLIPCAGCDLALGLERPDVSGDAPAAGPFVSELVVAGPYDPIAVGDVVEIVARVHALPKHVVRYTLDASAGTLAQTTGLIELDETGEAKATTQYTTPPAAATVTFSASVDDGPPLTRAVAFVPLVTLGHDDAGSSPRTIAADTLLAVRFDLLKTAHVRTVGLWTTSAAGKAKAALYDHGASHPGMRLVDLGEIAIGAGRNAWDVGALQLTQGSYWLVTLFDANVTATIHDVALGNAVRGPSRPYADGMPAMFGGVITPETNDYAYFMIVTE
jgi:hypothetical protein